MIDITSKLMFGSLPVNIALSLTDTCYSKCRSCNIWRKKPENELKTEEWKEILKKIGNGPVWLSFTGGETMLRHDILNISSFIFKYNHPRYLSIATSGIYPKKTIRIIREIMNQSKNKTKIIVNISIDEIGKNYKKIRGIDAYESVLETINGLKSTGCILGANMVLSRLNSKRFWKIYHEIKSLSLDSFVCEVVGMKKSLDFSQNLLADKKDMINILDRLAVREDSPMPISFLRKKYYKLVKMHLMDGRKKIDCKALKSSCLIGPTGDVLTCSVLSMPVGNLRDTNYSLKEILNSQRSRDVRKSIRDCFCNDAGTNYTNILYSPGYLLSK